MRRFSVSPPSPTKRNACAPPSLKKFLKNWFISPSIIIFWKECFFYTRRDVRELFLFLWQRTKAGHPQIFFFKTGEFLGIFSFSLDNPKRRPPRFFFLTPRKREKKKKPGRARFCAL